MLLSTAFAPSYSQGPSDWSLLPDGWWRVPPADLRLAAGYRLGQDDRLRNAVFQIAGLAGENRVLTNANIQLTSALSDEKQAGEDCEDRVVVLTDKLEKSDKKLSGSKAVNKVLVLAAGVLTVILVVK